MMRRIVCLLICASFHSYFHAQEMSKEDIVEQYNLAVSYMEKDNGRYAEAREILEKISPYADADIREQIFYRIPATWFGEGERYLCDSKFSQALACGEKARDGFHNSGGTKDEIEALNLIGETKDYMDDIKGAMDAYQQASLLAASIRNDSILMSILEKRINLSKQFDDNEQTSILEKKIDSLFNSTKDEDVRFIYYCYQGDVASSQGNFDLAKQWYKKNDSYIHQLDDNNMGDDRIIINYYYKLMNLYVNAKKWDEALKYATLYKNTCQRPYKKTDKEFYMFYGGIADVYSKMGDSIRCFQRIDTLFMSLERQDEPRAKLRLYAHRAACYSNFKNFEQALADFKTADSLLATKYSEDDGDRIRLWGAMGNKESQLEHYDESERLFRKYVEGIRKIYGENHSQYFKALVFLANVEGFANHIEDACNNYSIAANILKQQIHDKLPYMITAERNYYWKTVSKLVLNMTPFALGAKEYQTAFTRSCYDGLVLSKAFLLESERSTFDLIKKKGTEEDLNDFKMIDAMQLRIREWEKRENEYADSILELTSKIKQQESLLAGKCRSYGNLTSFMRIGYQEIKAKLNEGDVLLDFTDYIHESEGRTYAAYIIDSQQDYPLLKKLFTESKIDSLQVAYPDQYYESPYSEALYQFLWMPFKDKVVEGATVYYVPSQLLFQIALESLPTEDGTLLGEHYHFVRLSSARELVNLKDSLHFDSASGRMDAVLYGGLQYDLEKKVMEKEAQKYNIPPLLAFRGEAVRGDSIFRDLPNSSKEVKDIHQTLTSRKLSVKLYTGINGTEESFVSMNGEAPTILHLSTHGFYYTPDNAKNINYLRGYSDAMSLSGIVMSGGNAAWLGKDLPKDVLSGILTAADISHLDLNGVELVVLSACHSGRGKATSEGLYGLQRAFKKAGAETMILSLWEVSDIVGTELMTKFYKYLSDKDNHWNKRAAFDKAKSVIRKKYKDPFYWAGFVMLD